MTATFIKIFHTFLDEFIEHDTENNNLIKIPKEIDDYLINFILFSMFQKLLLRNKVLNEFIFFLLFYIKKSY